MSYIAAYPCSATAYVAVLIIITVLSNLADRFNKKSLAVSVLIVLSLFGGLRNVGVGIDTVNFAEKFYSEAIYGVEPGYVALMRLVGSFATFEVFLFASSCITYALFIMRMWELKEYARFDIMIVVFYCLYFQFSLNLIRQFLALAIVFWGSRYFFKRKYLIYVAIVIATMLIHKTAILALLLFLSFPMSLNQYSGNKRTGMLLLSLVLPFIAIIIVSTLVNSEKFFTYERYLEGNSENGIGLMFFVKLLLIIWIGMTNNLFKQSRNEKFYKSIYLFVACGICMSSLDYFFPYLNRVGFYLSIYEPVLYSAAWKLDKKQNHAITAVIILAICLYTMYVTLDSNGQGTMPYSAIWMT